MRFLIVTHVEHTLSKNSYWAYGPYVKEMNLWLKNVDEVEVCAPRYTNEYRIIDLPYIHESLRFNPVKAITLQSFAQWVRSLLSLPRTLYVLYKAMRRADHIHLRCPGNIGALGCVMQIFFPSKKKTAKYAGNWDPHAKQPKLYKIQKWILSNTFLTRNMTVLAYGEWPNQSKNVKSFFTATYLEQDRQETLKKFKTELRALFVGTMGQNKRPLETVQVVHALKINGVNITLDMYGAGSESQIIEKYIDTHALKDHVFLHGNQPAKVIKEAYKKSHFLILLSKSEGWPKVVAEAMFYGVVPIVTSVSCVPWMLGEGQRGFLLDDWNDDEIVKLSGQLKNVTKLAQMSREAQLWSQRYTLDSFESAIKKLL